jgi:hypothetical protein
MWDISWSGKRDKMNLGLGRQDQFQCEEGFLTSFQQYYGSVTHTRSIVRLCSRPHIYYGVYRMRQSHAETCDLTPPLTHTRSYERLPVFYTQTSRIYLYKKQPWLVHHLMLVDFGVYVMVMMCVLQPLPW